MLTEYALIFVIITVATVALMTGLEEVVQGVQEELELALTGLME